jgi:putative pre-16S rRNA nuclease
MSASLPGPQSGIESTTENPVESLHFTAMRVLGVDFGSKRIGLAVSDENGEFAFPAGTLMSRGRKKDLAALRTMIAERQVGAVVVGLPIHMDGRRGSEAERALAFAKELSVSAGIPVDTLDERWTSREAERSMQGISKKRRRNLRDAGAVDEAAASIILRTYLASRAARTDPDSDATGGEH